MKNKLRYFKPKEKEKQGHVLQSWRLRGKSLLSAIQLEGNPKISQALDLQLLLAPRRCRCTWPSPFSSVIAAAQDSSAARRPNVAGLFESLQIHSAVVLLPTRRLSCRRRLPRCYILHFCERIPLDFLSAEKFHQAAENYVQPFLTKGVPSLFPDLSPLYDHTGKFISREEIS